MFRDASWLTEDHFRARPGTWRVVVDYPFDDAGHSAAEDLARLDRMTESEVKSPTIVWLPRFLSDERMSEVRRLVILDWLLGGTGERWTTNADHLSEVDRAQARAILESQRTGLREALRRAVQESYGAAAPSPGTLADDAAHDRILVSLDSSFVPARPVGADLAAAFGNLIDQAFSVTYPGHPRFEPADLEITIRDLAAVYSHVERAVADQDGRVRLEGDIAAVRRVANPLQVGTVTETHFLFGDDRFPWGAEFERAAARAGLQPQDTATVEQVRGWLGVISPRLGLRDEVADLIVLAWAALRQRAWYHHGPIPAPSRGRSAPTWNCGPSRCPSGGTGGRRSHALSRCSASTSTPTSPPRASPTSPRTSARMPNRWPTPQRSWWSKWSWPTGISASPATAQGGWRLRAGWGIAGGGAAPGPQPGPRGGDRRPRPAGGHRDRGGELTQPGRCGSAAAIGAFRWDRLGPLRAAEGQADERGLAAVRMLRELRDAVTADEFTTRLGPRLTATDDAIFQWLALGQPASPAPLPSQLHPDDVPLQLPSRPRQAGVVTRAKGAPASVVLGPLQEFLDAHRDEQVIVEWRVHE